MPADPSGPLPQEMTEGSDLRSDAELYGALRQGDASALRAIYDQHVGLVFSIAYKVLADQQEAEDLTQDVFVSLTRGSTYDPTRGSLRTYLAILTRSRSIDRIRSRTSRQQLSRRWQSDPGETMTTSTPLDEASYLEQSQEVRTALGALSQDQQTILQMSYYEGLSQSEIAGKLGIPLGTVKARARRGLIKLKELLAHTLG